MPTRPRRRRLTAGVAAVCATALAIGVYAAVKHVQPIFISSGCHAGSGHGAVTLEPDQAANAATIAAVAHQRAMPPRAVTIAYAAALQESHLHNVGYGDRDSVGIFQQRPSEGWGPARRLRDPVYAATRFFEALAAVHRYQAMPVYRAAQAVQRSADGDAYIQYERVATKLTAAFTGESPHAVWCWPAGSGSAPGTDRAKLAAARTALVKAFGQIGVTTLSPTRDTASLQVRTGQDGTGWAVAAWLVTHADRYRLHEVRYAGFTWRSSSGHSGWAPGKGAGTAGAAGQGGHGTGTGGKVLTN